MVLRVTEEIRKGISKWASSAVTYLEIQARCILKKSSQFEVTGFGGIAIYARFKNNRFPRKYPTAAVCRCLGKNFTTEKVLGERPRTCRVEFATFSSISQFADI